MLRLWGSNTRCAFSVCASGSVPLEGYPVRVQHLVRAPARRGRWRGVGVDLSSALFILLLQCNGVTISVASGSERLHCGIHWSNFFYSMMVEFCASGFNSVVVLMWILEIRILCTPLWLGIILFSDVYSLAFGDDLVQG